jgi:hypothetical protein
VHLALVTTSPARPSGIGDHARALCAALAATGEVTVYVPDADVGAGYAPGVEVRPASTLNKKSADRILYLLGNERAHAFMLPLIRDIGGTVYLHDWVLFDLMTAAYPALERGGIAGHIAAWRCGGTRQRSTWAKARSGGSSPKLNRHVHGQLLMGWHEPEAGGRWTARRAGMFAPRETTSVQIQMVLTAGTTARLREHGNEIASVRAEADGSVQLSGVHAFREMTLEVDRTCQGEGDLRELGAFVQTWTWGTESGAVAVDLRASAALPAYGMTLSDRRFDLSFHRPVVRFGDSFIVHSEELADRILEDRRTPTPTAVVPHGVDAGLVQGDRDAARARLSWSKSDTLLVSFGAVQDHKRPGPLLEGVASARAAGANVHLVLAGAASTERFDLDGEIERLDLRDHVTVTGFLDESEFQDWLAAADVCVNLRGPSTGGTSGGVARAMAAGRATVISDLPEWAEFPDGAVVRVPLGDGEVAGLSAAFQNLDAQPQDRDLLEGEARRWAREVADWPLVGALVREFLEVGPAHRTRRKSLISTLVEGEEQRRQERAEGREE